MLVLEDKCCDCFRLQFSVRFSTKLIVYLEPRAREEAHLVAVVAY